MKQHEFFYQYTHLSNLMEESGTHYSETENTHNQAKQRSPLKENYTQRKYRK